MLFCYVWRGVFCKSFSNLRSAECKAKVSVKYPGFLVIIMKLKNRWCRNTVIFSSKDTNKLITQQSLATVSQRLKLFEMRFPKLVLHWTEGLKDFLLTTTLALRKRLFVVIIVRQSLFFSKAERKWHSPMYLFDRVGTGFQEQVFLSPSSIYPFPKPAFPSLVRVFPSWVFLFHLSRASRVTHSHIRNFFSF